jgi:hypothetical protein
MPVANLQSYRTVAVRVHSTQFGAQAPWLERAVLDKLQRQCGFEQVGSGNVPADVVLDLNITSAGRGGNGWVRNPNLATIDTLLVLTDGQDGELLGTARILGKSSGMIINNGNPENEATEVVANSIAGLLYTSGCSGPRIARVKAPPPPDTGTGSAAGSATGSGSVAPPPDESHRAEAEALNQQGKEKLYGADLPGALAAFQQANTLLPDARYEFNVCLALGAQEQWDNAIAACRQARGMNPQAALATKIDRRLESLQHHQ